MSEPEARALVDDLRAILERITDRELSPAAAELDGPRRNRWYEADSDRDMFEHARGYFDKVSPFGRQLNGVEVPFDVKWSEDDSQRIVGHIRIPRRYEGPPHHLHGGVIAGLFDDLRGGVQVLTPRSG